MLHNRMKYNINHTALRYFHGEPNEATPGVSVIQVKRTLKSFNVNFLEGHACIITACPVCETDKKKDSKVYINKTTGFFMCETCRHSGPWSTLEKFLLPKKSSEIVQELKAFKEVLQVKEDFTKKWTKLKKTLKSITELSDQNYKDVLNIHRLPDVSKESMDQLDCLYDVSTNNVYFPLITSSGSIVGYKCLSKASKKEKTEPTSDTSGLIIYKQRSTKCDGTAVVVPTIQDLLVLISHRSANVVICLPYGLQTIPQEILPSLETYKKLILWFGNDEPSWDTARQFAKKLDERRCHFVRPIIQQPSPKIAATMNYDLKAILQKATPIWHKSITTFESLRQDVLSDLQNIDKVQGVKWKRYPTLNRILKGHRRGEFTVLTGPTGSGKTTFMSEYSLDLAMQGVNTLWGSFEIRNARLARTMLQQMVGLPLDNNLQNFDTYADAFQELPIYFMTFHGQQSVKIVMEAVEHATYVHDIAHVIIDNVQFMMGMSEESKHIDRFWKQDGIVAAFRTFATKYNCHVTLVIHPRKERDSEELTTSSIFGGAKASQEADNILIIQDKRLTSVRGKKYLQVAKNRYSGDLGIMTMDFDKSSLSYAPKKKSKSESAKDAGDSKKEDPENESNLSNQRKNQEIKHQEQ
ncbi:twinkle protein, mitochondrial isoform X2 [Cephus cinctus]|uniref:DNA 5'-3' helicase n=1 Tax=Cephus cinctus TaxID=211228 RepID=A0AAJ7W6P6_CEPCN|nr:twinkle protein, mitochondrial isoform X2 [Cephus cinctus]